MGLSVCLLPQFGLAFKEWVDMPPKKGAVGDRDHTEGSSVLRRHSDGGGKQNCVSPGKDTIGVELGQGLSNRSGKGADLCWVQLGLQVESLQ